MNIKKYIELEIKTTQEEHDKEQKRFFNRETHNYHKIFNLGHKIKVLQEIENYIKENEEEQQARTTNEIVQSVADALKIEVLPKDERQQGYNETGDKLFNIIYKIIKNN